MKGTINIMPMSSVVVFRHYLHVGVSGDLYMKSYFSLPIKKHDYGKDLSSEYLILRVLFTNNEIDMVPIPNIEVDIFSSLAEGDQMIFSHMIDGYLHDYFKCTDCIKDWVATKSDNEQKLNKITKTVHHFDFDYI